MFDNSRVQKNVKLGDVVSVDSYGMLKQGAGTTLYRHVQDIENITMYHLHTAVIGENIHVAQYDNQMLVTVIDPDTDAVIATKTVDLPTGASGAHRVDDILVLNDNVVLSLGSNEVIPARVWLEGDEIKCRFGNYTLPYDVATIQPEMMALNETCVIISFYGKGNIITAVAGCLTDEDDGLGMVWGPPLQYSTNYVFHDIVGLDSHKFIVVHARVPWFHTKDMDIEEIQRLAMGPNPKATDSTLHYGLGTVYDNLTLSVGPIKQILRDSMGFMDMARLDSTTAVLTFINENLANAIQSILFKYDPLTDHLMVGGSVTHQSGGGSGLKGGLYCFIRVRAFSDKRFGVYYEDRAALGEAVLSMAEVTRDGGLVLFGPEFPLASAPADYVSSYYWANLAPATSERFFVMESLTVRGKVDHPHGSIHVGEVYPTALGIVTAQDNKQTTVTVDGIYKMDTGALVPGKEYMGNSNGELIEGDYVGLINSEAYSIFVDNEKRSQILTTDSQVGYAISDSELFIRIPDNIDV